MIYADPWLFKTRSDKGKDRSPEKHYPVLALADICAMDVGDIAKPDSVLLMWVCDPLLDKAFKVINAGVLNIRQLVSHGRRQIKIH